MIHPVIFFSHGSPTLPFDEIPARDFFIRFGANLERPKAILIFSAHWYEKVPHVTASAQPETIHDFFGFSKALYELQYPAPGDPKLAQEVAALLHQAGFASVLDSQRGLDHGAWNPFLLLRPKADIPILQISLIAGANEETHFRLGAALAPLRQDCLIVASGGAVHNLRAIDWQNGAAPDWAKAFDRWLHERIQIGDIKSLLNYRALAPYAELAHPHDDHLLPLFCALGAAGQVGKGKNIHESFAFGSLSMASYLWS